SVVLGLLSYFNRIRSERVKAVTMAVLAVGALVVYATVVRAHGIPQDTVVISSQTLNGIIQTVAETIPLGSSTI
ncbi:MAG TPA: hypothetical protein VLI40_00500, partial [Gemmatimonadaceae bacterium]|nr:hypothetical protein [Gemmatimonadaceae bacterium]